MHQSLQEPLWSLFNFINWYICICKKSRRITSAWGSAFQSQKTGVANWRRELHRTYFAISQGALRISIKEGGLSNLRLNSLPLLQSLLWWDQRKIITSIGVGSEEMGPFENIPWSFFSGSSSRRSLLLREEQNIKEYWALREWHKARTQRHILML